MNYTTPSPPLDWVLKRRFDSLRVFSSIKQPKISSILRALQSAMKYLQARSCALSKNSTADVAALVDADEVYSVYAMRILSALQEARHREWRQAVASAGASSLQGVLACGLSTTTDNGSLLFGVPSLLRFSARLDCRKASAVETLSTRSVF